MPDVTLVGHNHPAPYGLSILDTGANALVASGDNGGGVCIWNIPQNRTEKMEVEAKSTSELEPTFKVSCHEKAVNDVALAPESNDAHAVFSSVSDDGSIAFWDTRVPEKSPTTRVIGAHDADVYCCDWNQRKSHWVITGGADRVIKVWDCRALTTTQGIPSPVSEFKEHGAGVFELHWNTHNTNVFAAGSADATVTVWDLSCARGSSNVSGAAVAETCFTGSHRPPRELIFRHRGHTHKISNLDWCPAKTDSWLMASISEDDSGSTVQLWRMLDLVYLNRRKSLAELTALRSA